MQPRLITYNLYVEQDVRDDEWCRQQVNHQNLNKNRFIYTSFREHKTVAFYFYM